MSFSRAHTDLTLQQKPTPLVYDPGDKAQDEQDDLEIWRK